MTAKYDIKTLQRRLSKAKTSLVLDHLFFGTIALNMPFALDENLSPPTAATNGRWVKFHPEFVNTLTDDELLFVTAHEVCHPMFDHCTRLNGRHPVVWNVAADYVINQMLVDDKVGTMPKGCLFDKALHDEGKGVTDTIYNLVMKDVDKMTGPGTGNGTGSIDNVTQADGDQAELEAEWKVRTAQAAQAAKMAGKLSANQARIVGELLNPKVDWREVLRRFVMKVRDDQRSYARPNRRFIQQGIYAPSVTGEAMESIVVAIDTSGSIGQAELDQFAAEIRAISEDARPKTIEVLYFDHRVCHHDHFERDEQLHFAPHGGGGTAFSPIFAFNEEHNFTPACCIVLTDLCCSDFGPAPDYPVLWVSTMEGKAPWGEVTVM